MLNKLVHLMHCQMLAMVQIERPVSGSCYVAYGSEV